jgi:hypothetical protein
MVEQPPRVEREFHIGAAGDRWFLMRDLSTGNPYVLHRPVDEPEVELVLGSFLVLFHGEERAGLLQLIASLLPHAESSTCEEVSVIRAPRFISRWIPTRQI